MPQPQIPGDETAGHQRGRKGRVGLPGTDDQLDVLRLNVTTPLEMFHRFGGRLVQQGRGAMIVTGSSAST